MSCRVWCSTAAGHGSDLRRATEYQRQALFHSQHHLGVQLTSADLICYVSLTCGAAKPRLLGLVCHPCLVA
jgi:hypothetical protein